MRGHSVFLIAVLLLLACAGSARGQTPISSCGISIVAPGSYRLTNNLIHDSTSTCITVNVPNVWIDLHGFAIIALKHNTPAIDSSAGYLTVINGTIQNFLVGIHAYQQNVTLRDLTVMIDPAIPSKTAAGLGNNATVTNCQFIGYGQDAMTANGVVLGRNSIVNGSSFIHSFGASDINGGNGLVAGTNSVIMGSTADANEAEGVEFGDGSTVSNSISSNNGSYGFGNYAEYDLTVKRPSSVLRNNAALSNGINSSSSPAGFGSLSSSLLGNGAIGGVLGFGDRGRSTFVGNVAYQNYDGLFGGAQSTISGSGISNNAAAGLGVNCPADVTDNTAQQNPGGNLVQNGTGCNFSENLF